MFPTLKRLAASTKPASASFVRTKPSTGWTGVPIHPQPLHHLIQTYDATLDLLSTSEMPSTAAYRQSVEVIVSHRKSVVEGALNRVKHQGIEKSIQQVEEKLGSENIEDLIRQGDDELKLARKMIEWRA
jgi:NADH dehydrogenase (ubiquinone) 1 alpha subcomplex subunit 5